MFSLFRPKPRQALFICGCGHTGTTLVANMLAAHSEVFIPLVETEAFLKPRKARANYRKLRSEADASGKPYFAEKTPRHILRLALIRKVAPGAKFLIMVRDGRDVAASFVNRKGSPEAGIARWVEAGLIIERERAVPDVHLLRYEDLIVDPQTCLEAVAAFAGIPFCEDMLNYHQQQRHWFGAANSEHVALRNRQVNQPIFDGRGRWKDELSADHIALFNVGEIGSLMRQFGYI